ncbi:MULTISPECIES: hypothetical protein [unclassified Sphingopyxis]|jgi:hypothetical protein|uniref:hypothetical protein n=1 Tax=unclassified Sphingopyxis TaxID=2614943 RepID=UPI0007859243|nr:MULTISPECIES: hypothetical protein [unclassified Sphingopyxis]USI76544.1 hypothetical protein KEC45_17580 [Sphingopyxis sp. USTB-05]
MNLSTAEQILFGIAYVSILIGLGLQWADGGFGGNWPAVLGGFTFLNLALIWRGFVTDLKA